MTHTESNPASSAAVASPATCSNKSAVSNPEKLGSCTPNLVMTPQWLVPSHGPRPRLQIKTIIQNESVFHLSPKPAARWEGPEAPSGITGDTIVCMAMTLRLADDETEALRRRAELEQRSMQEVARQAIREYVENHSRAELLDQVLDEELPRYAEALERLGQ